MTDKKNTVDFGFDLGHGESAMCYSTQIIDSDSKIVNEVIALKCDEEGNYVIPTQMVLSEKQMLMLKDDPRPSRELLDSIEKIHIGKFIEADCSDIGEYERFMYFKSSPVIFDTEQALFGTGKTAKECRLTSSALMACYAYAFLTQVIANYNENNFLDNITPDKVNLYVGCPSSKDWTSDENREKYESLLQLATGANSVHVVPESRAAMFRSLEQTVGGERVSANNGAVIFDFGSSTADCTYMMLGRKLFDFSWSLGASEIETNMKNIVQEKVESEHPGFVVDAMCINEIKDTLRGAKEEFFTTNSTKNVYVTFKSVFGENDNHEEKVAVDSRFMAKATEDSKYELTVSERNDFFDEEYETKGSWKQLCESFFERAKKLINKQTYTYYDKSGNKQTRLCEVNDIILTGGASRMGFVSELCKQVFGDINIVTDPSPSSVVAKGLCWYAVCDNAAAPSKKQVLKAVKDNRNISFKALTNSIYESVADYTLREISILCQKWANDTRPKLSQQYLDDRIYERISEDSFKDNMLKECETVINKWKELLSNTLYCEISKMPKEIFPPRITKYHILPSNIWDDLMAKDLNIRIEKLKIDKIIKEINISPWLIRIFQGTKDGKTVPRKPNQRKRGVAKYQNNFLKNKSKLQPEVERALKTYKADFDDLIDKRVSVSVDVLLLKRFNVYE